MLKKSHSPMFPPSTVPHPETATPCFSQAPATSQSGGEAPGAGCSPTRWVTAGEWLGRGVGKLAGGRPDLGPFFPPNPGVCPSRAPVPAPRCQCGVGTWGRYGGSVTELPPDGKPQSTCPALRCYALLLFWEVAKLGNARRPEELAWGAGSWSQQGNSSPCFQCKVLIHPAQGSWENLHQVSGCQVSRRCLQEQRICFGLIFIFFFKLKLICIFIMHSLKWF